MKNWYNNLSALDRWAVKAFLCWLPGSVLVLALCVLWWAHWLTAGRALAAIGIVAYMSYTAVCAVLAYETP